MEHELDASVLQTGAPLGAISEHRHLLLIVPDADHGGDGVVVLGHSLRVRIYLVTRSPISFPLHYLSSIGVSEECSIAYNASVTHSCDHLLANKILHWNWANSPGNFDSLVIVINPEPFRHPILLVINMKLIIEKG